MKKIISFLLFAIVLTFICCTKDFIVKDIKKATMTINAPGENITTPNNAITFWWDELDGVEKYNLQIVKPNFNSVVKLLLDTNITTNKFNYTFTPGTYQWRVRATNASGSTAYVTRTLIIDTTSNLSNVKVNLIAPATNSVIAAANNNVTFLWDQLPTATSYELKLTALGGTTTIIPNIPGTSTSYAIACPTPVVGAEATYTWQVKAFNYSQTLNNTIYSFKIDHKSPSAPGLISPLQFAIVKDSSQLRWNYGIIKNDIKFDSVFIGTYPDSTFTSPIVLSVNRTSISVNSYSIYPTLTSPSNTLTASSYYYWKVKSVDSVGNVSPASAVYKFKLQN